MLGLAEQVGGDQRGVGGLVGQHGDLRRPGQQVDPDAAVELALGLGHVRVAGADDHVHGLDPGQPEGHRRQRLDAAEGEDAVRARQRGPEHQRREDALARDGGAQATTVSTPATFGTSTVMNGDANSGTRPAGR